MPDAPEWYKFRYPNTRSYLNLPASSRYVHQGRALRHGFIFGYKEVTPVDPASVEGMSADAAERFIESTTRTIDFTNSKIFQFNPAAISIGVTMMAVDSAAAEIPGGNANVGVGYASTRLELFFDRTEEIARANNGKGDDEWRDLGVQKDLFELLTVISGGTASKLGGYRATPTAGDAPFGTESVQPGSTNHLTGVMLDSAVAGNAVAFRSFAVVFNPNLAVHVSKMTSFAFTYLRFTMDLVPTSMKVEMDLEITNMGTQSHATAVVPVAGGLTETPPPDTLPPGTNMAVPI